jgi:hypothetical protein
MHKAHDHERRLLKGPSAAQDQLWGLTWDDLVEYLKEKHHDESVLTELERFRVA